MKKIKSVDKDENGIVLFGVCYDCNKLYDQDIESVYDRIYFKKENITLKMDDVFIGND